jgi:hypothetical protein
VALVRSLKGAIQKGWFVIHPFLDIFPEAGEHDVTISLHKLTF